ncbi:MAG: hypothetical protein V7752_07745 [Halopseudomonas sp.]
MGLIVRNKNYWLVLMWLLLLSQYALAQPKILVVHSWHDILWDRLWQKGLDEKLAARFELVRFDLDALRLTKPQLQQRVEQAWAKYHALTPELVILGDDVALRELGPRLANEDIPLVYLGINHNPRKYLSKTNGPKITGIIERPLYERAIRQITTLFPEPTKRVLFLNDSQPGEEAVTDLLRVFGGNASVTIQGMTIDLKVTRSWEQWQQEVLAAAENGYSVILFDSRYLIRDASERYVEPEAGVVRWMNQHSPVPIFSFYEDSIGPGLAIGGWVISGYDMGLKAGDMSLELLSTRPKKEMFPLFYDKARYIFSKVELDRWHIALPEEIRSQAVFVESQQISYDFDCAKISDSICY